MGLVRRTDKGVTEWVPGRERLRYTAHMALTDSNGWTQNDYAALVQMARSQGVPPDWFAAVFMAESGMHAGAQNRRGCVASQSTTCYQGLAQLSKEFLQSTMHMSPAEMDSFARRTPAQQMEAIDRYFRPWRPRSGWISRAQIYQATFLPATIARKGSTPNTVITRREDSDSFYEDNLIFDRAKKGFITVADLDRRMEIATEHDNPQGWRDALVGIQNAGGDNSFVLERPVRPVEAAGGMSAAELAVTILGGLVLGASTYYIYTMQKQRPHRRVARI